MEYIQELKSNQDLLELIGEDTKTWFLQNDIESLCKDSNVDYTTIFLMNAKPIETSIIDAKDEILIGLSNPVMQFYFNHGYELNLSASNLQTPDHIALEFAFMQNLVSRNELKAQKEFLQTHLLNWAVPYFLAVKEMAVTPLYRDLSDFVIEFLASDYDEVSQILQ
jgi:TorA maturation chaperone TorD